MQVMQQKAAAESKLQPAQIDEPMNPSVPTIEPAPLTPSHRLTFGSRLLSMVKTVGCWFDNTTKQYSEHETVDQYSIDKVRMIPYLGMHIMCLGVIWVSWSPIAVAVAVGL